ncbi:MAG: low molecular weight phosphotyrosine protein phosphatase, partial [Myroides sp.]
MAKILMVCLGNICRSPLAEGILKSKINSDIVFVDSAGTGAWHAGELPDKRSIAVAKKYGIDLTTQRA